jgi:hypothetical protein
MSAKKCSRRYKAHTSMRSSHNVTNEPSTQYSNQYLVTDPDHTTYDNTYDERPKRIFSPISVLNSSFDFCTDRKTPQVWTPKSREDDFFSARRSIKTKMEVRSPKHNKLLELSSKLQNYRKNSIQATANVA